MARVTGLEPATSGVTGQHSNQLSYTRALLSNQFIIGTSGRVRGSFVYVKRAYAFFQKNHQITSLFLRLEKFFLKECHSVADHCIGRLAQLVERFVYTEDVGSSSLSSPTI